MPTDNKHSDLTITYADLKQFQLTYSVEKDRIAIDFQTTQQQNCKVWLSRRFVKKIWSVLISVLQRDVQRPDSVNLQATDKRRIDKHHIEKCFEHKDNITPQLEFLGERKKALANTLKIRIKNDQLLELKFLDRDERGVVVCLSYNLFRVLCALLAKSVENAQWDLVLENIDLVLHLINEDEIESHTT